MFKTLAKDNATNKILIQGSVSKNKDKDISGIVFQNYDEDIHETFNMASIIVRDHDGSAELNGRGDLALCTSVGSNNIQERFRIDCMGNVGIGTTKPIYSLDVAGTIRALTYENLPIESVSFKFSLSHNVSLSNTQAIDFDISDSNLSHSSITGDGGFTIPVTGVYNLSACALVMPSSHPSMLPTHTCIIRIDHNTGQKEIVAKDTSMGMPGYTSAKLNCTTKANKDDIVKVVLEGDFSEFTVLGDLQGIATFSGHLVHK
jgi:hypothetical protein